MRLTALAGRAFVDVHLMAVLVAHRSLVLHRMVCGAADAAILFPYKPIRRVLRRLLLLILRGFKPFVRNVEIFATLLFHLLQQLIVTESAVRQHLPVFPAGILLRRIHQRK